MDDDDVILWREGDVVTDVGTGQSGTIADAGDGQDIGTMEINWEDAPAG